MDSTYRFFGKICTSSAAKSVNSKQNGEEKTDKRNNVDGKQNRRFKSHVRTSSTGEINCSFCNESEEHVARNGPKEPNIDQHFAYKVVIEMTPFERHQELSRKGFCIQCLLSGTMQNSEKHKHNDVKCQRDFI